MNTQEKIALIQGKLYELKNLDKSYEIFGASDHEYQFNKKLDESRIVSFETDHSVTLPEEYREFLKQLGNGGAGPYYGLESMDDSLYCDLDYKRPNQILNPSVQFPFTEPWNMFFDGDEDNEMEYEKFQKEYYDSKWETGIIRISNFGCAISINLVVNGAEKGHVWVDDRANGGGINPDQFFNQNGRTSFMDWYILWLNSAIKELNER